MQDTVVTKRKETIVLWIPSIFLQISIFKQKITVQIFCQVTQSTNKLFIKHSYVISKLTFANHSQLLINMIVNSKMLLVVLFSLALVAPNQASTKHPAPHTESAAMKSLLKPDMLNIVLFSDKNCIHCEPCMNAFGVLTEVNADNSINLLQLQLNDSNRHIFEQLKLQTLPAILAFKDGKRLGSKFQCLGSSNKLYRQMSKWLTRLEKSIQNWNQQESYAHQIIVDCSADTKQFWENVEQEELWLDLYCGNSTFLGDNLAVIAQYGQVIEAWRLQNKKTDLLHQKLRFLIKAYKYKFVVNWNVAIAQQIFAGNQSAFVMLLNNESYSKEVYSYFQQVKQNWYQQRQQHPVPILFAVTDLSENIYQTMRLKRYLTGVTTTSKKDYFYPILAFIEGGQNGQKYVMPYHLPKSSENIQKWIYSIYNTTVLKLSESEITVQPFLNEEINHRSPAEAEEDEEEPNKPYRYIKRQDEWRDLMRENFTTPFFVYVTWRNSYELQKLESQVIEWWKSKEQSRQVKSVLHINLLQNVDLPKSLKVSYVPSVLYVGKGKEIRKLEGVTDLNKIKRFVSELQDK